MRGRLNGSVTSLAESSFNEMSSKPASLSTLSVSRLSCWKIDRWRKRGGGDKVPQIELGYD